jgi:hypothetical protein
MTMRSRLRRLAAASLAFGVASTIALTPAYAQDEAEGFLGQESATGATTTVQATQGRADAQDTATDTGATAVIATEWQTILPNQTHWYTFDHAGDGSHVQVWMQTEPADGAAFRVFDEESAQAIAAGVSPDNFIGEGYGIFSPEQPGLFNWVGAFVEESRYYVMVQPAAWGNIRYSIQATGEGMNEFVAGEPEVMPLAPIQAAALTVDTEATDPAGPFVPDPPIDPALLVQPAQQQQVAPPQQVAPQQQVAPVIPVQPVPQQQLAPQQQVVPQQPVSPAAIPQPGVPEPETTGIVPGIEGVRVLPGIWSELEDPPVDARLLQNWRNMGETETHWYRFWHNGDGAALHVWMEIEPNEGAGFRVFNADNAEAIMAGANPNDFAAIGRGTRNPVEPGYLFWRGTFEEDGWFYLMVEHGWAGDIQYAIYGSGPGYGGRGPQ